MADKIMVIRHAEKPGMPPPPEGVDETGTQNPNELVVRGWQRAGTLACLFSSWGARAHAGLLVPVTIFATAAVHHNGNSLRPQHTVAPLCARLGIDPVIDIALGDEPTLAARAQAAPGPVLIAWHHEAIPGLGNIILGNNTGCPQSWDGDRFDLVWVFDRTGAFWQFSQVPQMLLTGDTATPIN